MDNKQKNRKSFFSSRKFKYGTAATVFTVFFIAVVILLNAIVSAVDSKYSLYFDLTDEEARAQGLGARMLEEKYGAKVYSIITEKDVRKVLFG